jgi:hypothetical protein
MTLYELSIEDARVREAESTVSLEGRRFPTIVVQWESRLFDQTWSTTIVLDYTIPLPPLMIGQATFNDVRIAALTDGAPTKFLYFGTEMTGDVPRVAPEMENRIGNAKLYQEFRLEASTCPLPYLKLIQATPRIYGNGPQDYYSPPIKVERYDGATTEAHLADFFPAIVANLESVPGAFLTDPNRGFWSGSRYSGVSAIAILRQGKVVGLHRRAVRADRGVPPSEVIRRDPKLDVRGDWVAIDLGAASTVAARRSDRGGVEFVRVGVRGSVAAPSDYENPTEILLENAAATFKAYRDRVVLPTTRWGDVLVGHAAKRARLAPGAERLAENAAALTALPLLRDRLERGETVRIRGRIDESHGEVLKQPLPPIIDEDGIGAHDPFDPVELYAYYLGLYINQRAHGLWTRYAITMPTGWSAARRMSVLVAMRRGLFRSLPAGLVSYDDLAEFLVEDAGPSAVSFAAQAFRSFGIPTRTGGVPFAVIDVGASETGLVFGVYRDARADEKGEGKERIVEYLEPSSIGWLGGERMLHRLAHRVFASSGAREAGVPFDPSLDEGPLAETTLPATSTPEGRANAALLIEALRGVLEGEAPVPNEVVLFAAAEGTYALSIAMDRAELVAMLQEWLADGVAAIAGRIQAAVQKIGREPDRFDGLHVFLAGRTTANAFLAARVTSALPSHVVIHRFKEPDRFNLTSPTVKTATALGTLLVRQDKVGVMRRGESRDTFRFRVGRARHGQLAEALDPEVEYDVWREVGACSKPDFEVLYVVASDGHDVAADDPRVLRAVCPFGGDGVGQRVYMRATGPSRVEVSVGPPGGEPGEGAPVCSIDLASGKVAVD